MWESKRHFAESWWTAYQHACHYHPLFNLSLHQHGRDALLEILALLFGYPPTWLEDASLARHPPIIIFDLRIYC
jgi:hypothetical protein